MPGSYNNGVATLPSVQNKDLRRMTVDDVAGMDAVGDILLNSPTIPWGSSVRTLPTPSIHQGSVNGLAHLCKEAGVPAFCLHLVV